MAWLDIRGTDIHYLEFGSGQPLLFLHGHSGNSPRNEPEPDRVDELEAVLAPLAEAEVFLARSAGTFTEDWVQGRGRELARYAHLRATGTRLEAQRHPRQATATRPSRDPAELVPLVKGITSPLLAIVGRLDADEFNRRVAAFLEGAG
jgi:pimeloyl-ACP methyl ester carboxylesterase